MFVDISSNDFKNIFEDKIFHLPKRWSGRDFQIELEDLFNNYLKSVEDMIGRKEYDNHNRYIEDICKGILHSISLYHSGYPSKAFDEFHKVMQALMENPLKTYQKTSSDEFFKFNKDPLKLFRIRNVQQNIPYSRADIFHTPYNLRSKVNTCRYSIAGHPSLYLGTSLGLCMEEAKVNSFNDLQIASRFEIVRNQNYHNTSIRVVELAIKPQDFLGQEYRYRADDSRLNRYFDGIQLNKDAVRSAYISWYPLIAACSFIRTSKADPFASEYIIPQLLMQWIRWQYAQHQLFGIRYFSCASEKASDMGFNYVFPTSGERYRGDSQYCDVLARTFKVTLPEYIGEYTQYWACENALIHNSDLNYIL